MDNTKRLNNYYSLEFAKLLQLKIPAAYRIWKGRNFSKLSINDVLELSRDTDIAFIELVMVHGVGKVGISVDEMERACNQLGQTLEIGTLIDSA